MRSYNGFDSALRTRAGRWLNAEIAAGRVERPTECLACGQKRGRIDSHAEDYSEPFGPHIYAFPLCFRCHMMIHSRWGAGSVAFERYVEELEAGHRWPPTGHYDAIRAMLIAGHELTAPALLWALPEPTGDPSLLRELAAGVYDPRRRR